MVMAVRNVPLDSLLMVAFAMHLVSQMNSSLMVSAKLAVTLLESLAQNVQLLVARHAPMESWPFLAFVSLAVISLLIVPNVIVSKLAVRAVVTWLF